MPRSIGVALNPVILRSTVGRLRNLLTQLWQTLRVAQRDGEMRRRLQKTLRHRLVEKPQRMVCTFIQISRLSSFGVRCPSSTIQLLGLAAANAPYPWRTFR